jgi:site-specific DNA-adenine methylase
MSLTDFKAKMNKSKINKYKINNNNKTNTKHEFNVKYERYKQDISKDRKLCFLIFTWNFVSTNLQKFAVILLYQQIKPSLLLE